MAFDLEDPMDLLDYLVRLIIAIAIGYLVLDGVATTVFDFPLPWGIV